MQAAHLNKHFPNYIPIDKENYVKYDEKRAFIDILAKDNDGNFIIIELKKSNNAARQSIHEVIKYTEFVKKQYAVNDDEIKLVIISTEWDELFIPFSKFYFSHNMFDIEGIKLNVNQKGEYISHKIIKPMKITNERVFSPEHFFCYYNNLDSLQEGYISFKNVMKSKQIDDYILYTLKRPSDVTYHHDFQYIVYFAMLRKTQDEYEYILKKLDKRYSPFDLQLGVGAGIKYKTISLKASYDWGMLDRDNTDNGVWKNNDLKVSLGYNF